MASLKRRANYSSRKCHNCLAVRVKNLACQIVQNLSQSYKLKNLSSVENGGHVIFLERVTTFFQVGKIRKLSGQYCAKFFHLYETKEILGQFKMGIK